MSAEDPTTILGKAEGMVRREVENALRLEAEHRQKEGETELKASFHRKWGDWLVEVAGKWIRRKGPDDGRIEARVEKRF